jgi:hypothetical protein
MEADRDLLDGLDLPMSLAKSADGALLPLQRPARPPLLRSGLVIQIQAHRPIPLHNVAGNVSEAGDRAAGDVQPFYAAFFDVPGEQAVASSAVRVFADPAGTENITGADFEKASLDLIDFLSLL